MSSKKVVAWRNTFGLLSNLCAIVLVSAQIAILFWGVKFLFPNLWARQLSAGFTANAVTFLFVAIASSFGEWFFHRDMQHGIISSWLKFVYYRHTHHHELTIIKIKQPGTNTYKIVSEYPMDKLEKYESVFFPGYMLVSQLAFYTFWFTILHQIIPNTPLFLGGYLAVGVAEICYELFHPLEHYPAEWWEKRKYNPFAMILRPYISYLRRFHQYHHLNNKSNMAISGFFGLPLADMVLGTYKLPPTELINDALVNHEDIAPPKFNWFVKKHDLWIDKRSRERRIKNSNLRSLNSQTKSNS